MAGAAAGTNLMGHTDGTGALVVREISLWATGVAVAICHLSQHRCCLETLRYPTVKLRVDMNVHPVSLISPIESYQ